MTKTILRSAIAAVIGIVVAFGLIWLAQYAGSEFSPAEYDVDSGEILIPLGSTIALIMGWFIGTFAGAVIGEVTHKDPSTAGDVAKSATGATVGRILGVIGKTGVAAVCWCILVVTPFV